MKDEAYQTIALPWAKQFSIDSVCDNFPTLSRGPLVYWAFLAVIFVTSIYLCTFGYRFYRCSSFLIAGLLGSAFCYLLCASENILDPYINVIISGLCGFLCATIASLHSKLGFFITGFCVGSITGAYCVVAISILAEFQTLWLGLTLCFLCGIGFALLSLLWQKLLSVANTSFVAGFLMFIIFDYILEQLVLAHYGWVTLIEASSTSLCEYSWVAIAIWPIVFIAGILVQYLKTARYFDHLEDKKVFDDTDENDTPKKSLNGTLRSGKTATPEGAGTKTSKSTLRQYSGTRYTGDIVPKNLAGNNALPTTMRTAARMRAMAAQNAAGTLAAGFPAGMELGPEYQVMGSTVYYGDNYSEYGAAVTAARQGLGPLASTMGGLPPGAAQKGRRRGPKRQSSNTNDSSLYEDVDDEDQYCAIDYDQIKNYEYGYAQYGPAQLYMGQSASGPIDAQQLVMMQQQQIYRQQQSRTSTLGSTRGGPDGNGVYQRMPAAGSNSATPGYQTPVSNLQEQAGDGIQIDNVPVGAQNGPNPNVYPPARSPPMMQRGPTRAPPPPPASNGVGEEDYMEPITSSSTSKV